MEILPEEEKAEKVLYLIIAQLNEVYKERKLRNFEQEWHHYLEGEIPSTSFTLFFIFSINPL